VSRDLHTDSDILSMLCQVALVAALCACLLVDSCEPAHADAPTWTRDEVAIARLTVSEASFGSSTDARVITWIVSHAAARRGMAPAQYVAEVHHRHTRSERRPWLAGLDETLREPAGWPADVPWQRGAIAWEQRLADVRRYLADDRHGCDGTPVTWGSPRLDADGIARWTSRGYSVLRCGGTSNVMIGRRP
jgi:hypothetical protein